MQTADIQVIKDIPGYKVILKAVLKTQIQQLVEQLAENTGEESVILTASVSDGTLSHLGSDSGKVFLEDHDDIKTQFLGFCLKRHHRQKQIEKEKQEQLERQRESESLMQASARIMNVPTTPTRFTGMRPRFTPTRLQTSPRQPQFSPRFQTSPRQSFGSASPGGRIQSSPRLQSVPLSGINNVRHEPYPQNRPRRTSLNFNQQGRSPNPNLSQKLPSTMRLPTEPQKVKKINIDPNEVIKIEAADDEEEEVQQKSKTKQSVKRPESTSSETGIKIASVTGATETNVKLDTASSGTATKTIETSEAPSLSSAPSPATPTLAISSSNMPVLSPIPKDESSNSSASTIPNEPVSGKVIDIVPPEGLSLDSDLSNLTGIPAETKTEEKSNSSSAASSVVASASQDSDSGTEPTVSVKVEALTESEMDLEITGIEPGQVAPRALNVQSRMESGPSTSGMEEGMGSQMNPEYRNQTRDGKSRVDVKGTVTASTCAPKTQAAPAVSKPVISSESTKVTACTTDVSRSTLVQLKAQEKDVIKSWSESKQRVGNTNTSDSNDDVIIVDDQTDNIEPVPKRIKVEPTSKINRKSSDNVVGQSVQDDKSGIIKQTVKVERTSVEPMLKTNIGKNKNSINESDDVVVIDLNDDISKPPALPQQKIQSIQQNQPNTSSLIASKKSDLQNHKPNTRKNAKGTPELIIDIDEVYESSGVKTEPSCMIPPHCASQTSQVVSSSTPLQSMSTPIKTEVIKTEEQDIKPQFSTQQKMDGHDKLYYTSPQSKLPTNTLSPPVSPPPHCSQQPSVSAMPPPPSPAVSPPTSPQQMGSGKDLIPPMSPQQKQSLQKFQCGDCGKGFASKASLTQHHRTHTGDKPFACDVCGKSFSVKQSVKNHILKKHFKEPK